MDLRMDQPLTEPSVALASLEAQLAELRALRERDRRALDVLRNISVACRGRASFREVFEATRDELGAVFPLDACYIALCDLERADRFRAVLLYDQGLTEYLEDREHGALTGLLVRNRAPLLFRDLAAERERVQGVPHAFGNITKPSRAWMGVPMLIGDSAVGVISVQSYTPHLYDEADLDLLQRIANVVAVALENVNLSQHQQALSQALAARVAQRTEELAALSTLAAEMVLQRPLPALIDRALELALPLLAAKAGNVRLYDPQRNALVLLAQRGLPPDDPRLLPVVPVEGSVIGGIVREDRPLVVPERLQERSLQPRVATPFQSLLGVPLRSGAQVLGTMSVLDTEPRAFGPQQVDLAQVIGNMLAIAVEQSRLMALRERQIRELRALSAISQAANTALGLRGLLEQVYRELAELMPLDVFVMTIYDPRRGVILEGVGIDEGRMYDYFEENEPPAPGTFTAWIIENRAVLHLRDVAAELVRYPGLRNVLAGSGRPAAAYLGAPLLDRTGRVIGTIGAQSYRPGAFDEGDERFLLAVAQQAALHVQNVALLRQHERQIRELDTIGRIGRAVSATFDLDDMLRMVYEHLQALTGASSFFVIVCDPQSHVITHSFYIDDGERIDQRWPANRPPPGSLAAWILTNRQPLLFTDLPAQRAELARRGLAPQIYGSEVQPRSWAGVPLLAQDAAPIGVLAIQDSRPHRYDEQSVELLRQVAAHLSLGIQKVTLFQERERQLSTNARLYAEVQAHAAAVEREAQRMALVHRISLLLSSRLDQQEILELAARELVKLFWADHIGIVLFEDQGRRATLAAEYPERGAVGLEIPARDSPIYAQLVATRRPICITSVADDPLAEVVRAHLRSLGVVSMMIVPLLSRGEVIGSIGLDSIGAPRSFTEDEQELFLTVAAAVAAACENARLFAAEQEARRTADTLREVARVLSSSFDSREVLRIILDELHKVIPYDSASVMLLEGELLRLAAFRGWEAPGPLADGPLMLDEQSAAGTAVRLGRPLLIADTAAAPMWKHRPLSAHIRSWMGVPLIAKGATLGVLNIDSRRPNRFSERDVEVATAFARQAAVALENARLYQESVTRVEQELEIARQIQGNLFPRELPVVSGLTIAARCLPARETGGDFYDLVLLDDSHTAVGLMVGDASGKSIPGAMLMAVARSTARSEARDHALPETVMRETNRLIALDVPPNAFVALCYGVVDAAARRLALANAGQLSPLRRRADGQVEYLHVPGPTLPLGIHPDTPYQTLEVPLQPGDLLVFYTDGIVEAHDGRRALFGFERLERLVYDNGHLPPEQVVEAVLGAVVAFAGETPQHDDMTIVAIRIE
jgi:sigma-B regulation protein RsbU (phosphoserine phosphatase)